MKQNKLIHVGYTNSYQVGYAKEDQGAFYHNTEGDCYIPLYMLDVHLHRLGPDSEKHDYVHKLEETNKEQAARINELEKWQEDCFESILKHIHMVTSGDMKWKAHELIERICTTQATQSEELNDT